MDYDIFDTKLNEPYEEASRQETQAAYDRLISNRAYRLEQLSQLVEQDGVDLDFSEASLQKLGDWFYEFAQRERSAGHKVPSPKLESVCIDIGIYLAEMLMRISDQLHWVFWVRHPKDLGYQRPVVTGFNVENKDFYVDFASRIRRYAYRLLNNREKENDLFVSIFQRGKSML